MQRAAAPTPNFSPSADPRFNGVRTAPRTVRPCRPMPRTQGTVTSLPGARNVAPASSRPSPSVTLHLQQESPACGYNTQNACHNGNSTNSQLPSGSFHCGKNCATCPYIFDGLTTYTLSTGETRPIESNFTCETKNVIFIIQCQRCNFQFRGKTTRRLKDRFNEHRRTVDNPNSKSKPTKAAEHFLFSPNHTASDMLLIPIAKISSNRDSIR